MYFESFEALLEMGGHGPYVWAAYLITLTVMFCLVWTPLQRHRRFLREEKNRARRDARVEQHATVQQTPES